MEKARRLAFPYGKFKDTAAHGEGHIKGFLDTGSTPVISTTQEPTARVGSFQ